MTGIAGQWKGDELWLRCPHCGDSDKDLRKAHYSINREGLYHCVRCKAGGRLNLRDYLSLVLDSEGRPRPTTLKDDDWEDLLDELMPGAGSRRFSALDRYHLTTGKIVFDVFLSRDIKGDIVGLSLVDPERHKRKVMGRKFFGYRGDLESSPDDPLRVVEGPYDCLTPRDVCVFGLPSVNVLRGLQGHFVILCPDGDVWPDWTKRKTILDALSMEGGPTFVGVEVLRDGEDPDEVPYEQRRLVEPRRVLRRFRKGMR